MARPAPYDKTFDFSQWQAAHPTEPLPGVEVDRELDDIERALDETQGLLNGITRDDGQLANKSVHWDTLDDYLRQVLHDAANLEDAIMRAEAAAEAAEEAWDNFRGTYYGALPVDPTVDPLGNPPTPGDLYFNTTNTAMRVRTGTDWIDVTNARIITASYTGTGVQTTFVLPIPVEDKDQIFVFLGTGYTATTAYTASGTTLAFAVAPGNGVAIQVRILQAVLAGTPGVGTVDSITITNDPIEQGKVAAKLGTVSTVANIAALRALPGPFGTRQRVMVSYHTTYQWGGGGSFTWDAASAAADDNGWVINPIGNAGNGRWLRDGLATTVTPDQFGAAGDGVTNDLAPINAAFSHQQIELPKGRIYMVDASVTLALGGQVLTGPGAIQLNKPAGAIAGRSCSLIVAGAGVRVEGIKIIGNALERPALDAGIRINGNFARVRNNEITGSVAEYILVRGSYNTVQGNFLNGEVYYTNSGVVVSGFYDTIGGNHVPVHGNLVTGNRFHWVRGFGAQTRLFANSTTISNNKFFSPIKIEVGTPATFGQDKWNFVAPWFPNRYGVRVNGVPVPTTDYVVTRDAGSFDVLLDFDTALNTGDIPTLYMYFSLESVNVNTQSYGTQVLGNQIDGSGDSGIVPCSDYHNGVINPAASTSAEYPNGTLIQGNVVKNCHAACVAMTVGAPGTSIIGNHFSEWSLTFNDGVFSAGVVLTSQGICKDNTFQFNGVSTRFGPTHNGSVPAERMTDGDAYAKFGSQIFLGTPVVSKYRIPNQSTTSRKIDLLFTDQPFVRYPGQVDMDTAFASGQPANTPYFTYGHVGTGWVRDLTDKLGGNASVTVTNGDYVDIILLAKGMLLNTNLQVEAMAKADVGTGFLRIFSEVGPPAAPIGPVMEIIGTGWRRWTYRLAITNQDQVNGDITIRAGADVGGTVHFQAFDISYQRIPT